jgi:hypothetical protein
MVRDWMERREHYANSQTFSKTTTGVLTIAGLKFRRDLFRSVEHSQKWSFLVESTLGRQHSATRVVVGGIFISGAIVKDGL